MTAWPPWVGTTTRDVAEAVGIGRGTRRRQRRGTALRGAAAYQVAAPGGDGGDGWVDAHCTVGGTHMELAPPAADAGGEHLRIPLATVDRVDELAPFDTDPTVVELALAGGRVLRMRADRDLVGALCTALVATRATQGPEARAAAPFSRVLAAAGAVLMLVGAVVWWPTEPEPPSLARGSGTRATTTTAPPPAAGATATPASMPTTSTTTTVPPTTAPPPPVETAIAPLTGLPAPVTDLFRPAIVSKIDASLPAMPQVGLEQADVVYEVMIESGSRYLAVFHSSQPAVVGPHRSARTTDPDLLAMFGHPLFAFSGANDGVVDALALTTWKTGVGPGEVGQAYFRDEQRPWPHNLFARTEVLRTRRSPLVAPPSLFTFHGPEGPSGGIAVPGLAAHPGVRVEFRWDPALGGWRRRIHGQEHLHASGSPVAPTNVVVLETTHRTSFADVRSPEVISVGTGRAWVYTRGLVNEGTWTRWLNTDAWNLRDAAGAPLTLEPGTTWVVLAERTPEVLPG